MHSQHATCGLLKLMQAAIDHNASIETD